MRKASSLIFWPLLSTLSEEYEEHLNCKHLQMKILISMVYGPCCGDEDNQEVCKYLIRTLLYVCFNSWCSPAAVGCGMWETTDSYQLSLTYSYSSYNSIVGRRCCFSAQSIRSEKRNLELVSNKNCKSPGLLAITYESPANIHWTTISKSGFHAVPFSRY